MGGSPDMLLYHREGRNAVLVNLALESKSMEVVAGVYKYYVNRLQIPENRHIINVMHL